MRIGLAAAVAASALFAAPASAALVIDDFYNNGGYPDFAFPAVQAYAYPAGQQLVATGSSTSGTIIGGERDARVEITNTVGYPGDNNQATGVLANSYYGPYNTGLVNFGVGAGGVADFLLQYDGVDGSIAQGPGLNLDAASHGDKIRLTSFSNLIITPDGTGHSPFTVRLTDTAGNSASLTRAFTEQFYGPFVSLDYEFAQFEAGNALLNLNSIAMIEILTTVANASFYDNFVYLTGIGIAGQAYGATGGGPNPAAVPEPGLLGLFGIGAFGLFAARRRAR